MLVTTNLIDVEKEVSKENNIKSRRNNLMDDILKVSLELEENMIKLTTNFPKRERMFLVRYIRDGLVDLNKMIIKAHKSDKPKSSLYEAATIIAMLTLHIRRSMELNFISYKQYRLNSEKAVLIKKYINTWITFELNH